MDQSKEKARIRNGSTTGRSKNKDLPREKSSTELELENLVFGDDEGFHQTLQSRHGEDSEYSTDDSQREDTESDDPESTTGEEEQLEDLFMIDTIGIAANLPETSSTALIRPQEDADNSGSDPEPVWIDSDDERVTISLAGNPQLRKLRTHADEDLVTGTEYAKRLRKQFKLLHPTPAWALPKKEQTRLRRARRKQTSGDDESDEDSSADEPTDVDLEGLSAPPLQALLRSAGNLTQKSSDNAKKQRRKALRPETLDIRRTYDIPGSQLASIDSLSFHPNYPLLLSSGPAATINIHELSSSADPPNPLLTSLHVRRTPLWSAAFDPLAGHSVYFSGRRRYFHVWNLPSGEITKVSHIYGRQETQKSMEKLKPSPCGRWLAVAASSRKGVGIVNVLDSKSLHWLMEARVGSRNGLGDFDWWGDGNGLTLVGKGGEVVEWSITEERMVGNWIDEGGIGITVVRLGGNDTQQSLGGNRWIAIGSTSGIVNIYDRRQWTQGDLLKHPKPAKTFTLLTTAVGHLAFSPDGQLLAMASRWMKDALRLIHLPTCSVYKNWPTSSTPLGRISSVAFSAGSNMLAVGNDGGQIKLWEIWD
ncbi:MAG: hypothetical protein M1814_001796 [Vezdaea aestivalis]|nr:MAG: hypothetical protein M1814_001796 [Vezdaea aestivalis]